MAWTSLCDLDELQEGQGKIRRDRWIPIGGFFSTPAASTSLTTIAPMLAAISPAEDVEGGVRGLSVACMDVFVWTTANSATRLGVTIKTYPTRVIQPSGDRPKLIQADLRSTDIVMERVARPISP